MGSPWKRRHHHHHYSIRWVTPGVHNHVNCLYSLSHSLSTLLASTGTYTYPHSLHKPPKKIYTYIKGSLLSWWGLLSSLFFLFFFSISFIHTSLEGSKGGHCPDPRSSSSDHDHGALSPLQRSNTCYYSFLVAFHTCILPHFQLCLFLFFYVPGKFSTLYCDKASCFFIFFCSRKVFPITNLGGTGTMCRYVFFPGIFFSVFFLSWLIFFFTWTICLLII